MKINYVYAKVNLQLGAIAAQTLAKFRPNRFFQLAFQILFQFSEILLPAQSNQTP